MAESSTGRHGVPRKLGDRCVDDTPANLHILQIRLAANG